MPWKHKLHALLGAYLHDAAEVQLPTYATYKVL